MFTAKLSKTSFLALLSITLFTLSANSQTNSNPESSNKSKDVIKLLPSPNIIKRTLSPSEESKKQASEFYWSHDFKNAVKFQKQAISEMIKENGEVDSLFRMYEALSNYADGAKDLDAYYQGYLGQLECHRKSEKLAGIEQILILLGGIELQIGNYESAINHLNESIVLMQKKTGEERKFIFFPYLYLGASYFESKNYSKATETFTKITDLSLGNMNSSALSISHLYLARINEAQGKKALAAQFYEKAVKSLSYKEVTSTANPYDILQRELLKSLTKQKFDDLKVQK